MECRVLAPKPPAAWPPPRVPVSGRHGDTAQTCTARSGTVPTRPDTVRHGLAWRGLAWLIEVRGLANRSEGLGAGLAQALSIKVRGWGPGWPRPCR